MLKASQCRLTIASLAISALAGVALANPVTDADLRGKTVCWSYGGTKNSYHKDGSFDSNLAGHGTWSLSSDRLTEHGDHGVYTFTIDKQGGKLHMFGRTPGGGSVEVWGDYCG